MRMEGGMEESILGFEREGAKGLLPLPPAYYYAARLVVNGCATRFNARSSHSR